MLQDLPPLPLHTVVIRGVGFAVRPLCAADEEAVDALLPPEPQPPLAPDPARGSKAAWSPNRHDPDYVRRWREWGAARTCLRAAAALEACNPRAMTPEGARIIIAQVRERLTYDEIALVVEASTRAEVQAAEQAAKNS